MKDNESDPLGERQAHPSYALIGVARLSGGGGNHALFGSSIRHNEIVRLRISPAHYRRNLNHDWFFAHGIPFIEVDMSFTQFAEAIMSFGVGSGVPCTVHTLNGEHVMPPPWESKRETFEGEFKAHAEKVGRLCDDLIAHAETLRDKPAATKGERADLVKRLAMLRQEIAANMPFVAMSFNEQMDQTTHEAKGEVEAFVMRKVTEAGLAAFRDGSAGMGELTAPVIEIEGTGDEQP